MLVTLVDWATDSHDGMTGEELLGLSPTIRERFACFYCGDGLNFPFVFWSGQEAQLTLHPECAKTLGMHLIGDGMKEGLTRPGMQRVTSNLSLERVRREADRESIIREAVRRAREE